MLRSIALIGTIALSLTVLGQPAEARGPMGFNGGGWHGNWSGGRGFDGRHDFNHGRFFGRDRFFFGFGSGGYPYSYPYYGYSPYYSYYPYYYPYYPYYP